MSDPVNQAESAVKSAVQSEVTSVKSKIAAFISNYKVHAIVGSGSYVAGHFNVLGSVLSYVVKHVL